MGKSAKTLASELLSGNQRSLARAISVIEDDTSISNELVELLYPHTGKAHIIGVTGSPGAGKSTLVNALAQSKAKEGKRVAILAIDPSSPFTGGALLGDRIRMLLSAESSNVYIRSMASRGELGGLAPKTSEAIFALDAAGFDYILLETVGVGQGEVEVVRSCDTVLVVAVPGMGDTVQALKAGILEIADIFVINKADYDGADRLEHELIGMLALDTTAKRKPPIVRTVAPQGQGVDQLWDEIDKHKEWAQESGFAEERRDVFLKETIYREANRKMFSEFMEFITKHGLLSSAIDNLRQRKSSPSEVVADILIKLRQQNNTK